MLLKILPERVLRLIREYSKPLTHPDWRQLKIMTQPYFARITHNARPNNVLYKFIQDYPYRIIDTPFRIRKGQSYFCKRIKYTITDILPNLNINLIDSFDKKYNGLIYVYYKYQLYDDYLKRMEGVYIELPKRQYLNQTNYICI
jgi:hypothetical protein